MSYNPLESFWIITMPSLTADQVTHLLHDWKLGNDAALEKLVPLIYDELHHIAHRYMRREFSSHSMQTTALVHEAYLRLAGMEGIDWKDRSHLFGITARLMRQILVDAARARNRGKRGGGQRRVTLDDDLVGLDQADDRLLALNEGLEALFGTHERKSRVVELRYFGGFSVEETAKALNISKETVMRDWRFARAWLRKRLTEEPS